MIELQNLGGRPSANSLEGGANTRGSFIRITHLWFLASIYLASLLMLVAMVVQWVLLTKYKPIHRTAKNDSELALQTSLVAFLLLLMFVFFYKEIKRSQFCSFVYVLVLVEISGIIVCLPIVPSTLSEKIYACGLTALVFVIALLFSVIRPLPNFTSNQLIMWTCRTFVASCITLTLANNMRAWYLDICLSTAIIMIISIFIFMVGKTLGSADHQELTHNSLLIVVLEYLNFLILYTSTLIWFYKTRSFRA